MDMALITLSMKLLPTNMLHITLLCNRCNGDDKECYKYHDDQECYKYHDDQGDDDKYLQTCSDIIKMVGNLLGLSVVNVN